MGDALQSGHGQYGHKLLHVVSVSGGKDSLATLLIALGRCPAGSVIGLCLPGAPCAATRQRHHQPTIQA